MYHFSIPDQVLVYLSKLNRGTLLTADVVWLLHRYRYALLCRFTMASYWRPFSYQELKNINSWNVFFWMQIYQDFLLKDHIVTRNSRKLRSGTWLFEASWWKVIKDLLSYEIVQVSLFLLTGGAQTVNVRTVMCIWLARLSLHWHSHIISSRYENL